MTERSVLQEGGARRGGARARARVRRRRRRALLALLTLALGLTALLAVMASQTAGPVLPRHRLEPRASAIAKPPPPPTYATELAPVPERVEIRRLKNGLRSGLLFDVQTGRVLWERDPDVVTPIASLTKMMTAVVVVEHAAPNDGALITTAATHFTGSGVGMLPLGKRVPVIALLYGLLLPSGNDAAIALAQHVAGNQRRFVAMMNQRASEAGLTCTHFSSVSGIVDQDNYSCAKDVATLAHTMLEQPLLRRIVGSRSAVLQFPVTGGKLYLYNNNPLLLMRYPGADGVKTGYTLASGQCLVATARRGRAWLGAVLLHSGDAAGQAEQLLNAGFLKLSGR